MELNFSSSFEKLLDNCWPVSLCLEVDFSHMDFFVSLHSFSHIGLALVARNIFLKGTEMENEMM